MALCRLLLSLLLLQAAPLLAAPLLLIAAAAAVGYQAAAPSAAGCSIASPLLLRRKIVCIAVIPSPRLYLATAPLAQPHQKLSLLGRTCSTRLDQASVAASLSIVMTLIRSSDEDLRQTGHIHPDCPCAPIAVLQNPATIAIR